MLMSSSPSDSSDETPLSTASPSETARVTRASRRLSSFRGRRNALPAAPTTPPPLPLRGTVTAAAVLVVRILPHVVVALPADDAQAAAADENAPRAAIVFFCFCSARAHTALHTTTPRERASEWAESANVALRFFYLFLFFFFFFLFFSPDFFLCGRLLFSQGI